MNKYTTNKGFLISAGIILIGGIYLLYHFTKTNKVQQEEKLKQEEDQKVEENSNKKSDKSIKRQKAINELIATEKTYVNRLSLVIKYYVKPLKDSKIITHQQQLTLFSDIETIHELNLTFLSDLQQSIHQNDIAMGGQFIKFTPYFKMYQNYMNKYQKAIVLLPQLLSKNKKFKEFCDTARLSCNNQQLQSFLILPIQRMPRYNLSLTEIIKNTGRRQLTLTNFKIISVL